MSHIFIHFDNCHGPSSSLRLGTAWISNDMFSKLCDETTYPFPNFNGATFEGWEWISNFILHFMKEVSTYPCWD